MTKTILTAALALGLSGLAFADIQNPPMDRQTPVTKLGRGLGNIAFGVTEIPSSIAREQRANGTNAAWSTGLANGAWRTVKRVGYGAFEVVTFPVPTYKGTYRQPYTRGELYPTSGLTEHSPEMGFRTGTTYSRQHRD